MVKDANATPDDYFSLAKLYLKKDDWTNYREQMHNVLGTRRGQPAGLPGLLHQSLLERKELDEADNWLTTLEKVAPNNFDAVRLRAEYPSSVARQDEAGDLAMAFLENFNALPKDRGQQLALVAQLMEGLANRLKAAGDQVRASKFMEKAETLFGLQRSKSISTVGDIIYAAYLARQKRRSRMPRCPGVVRGQLPG